VERQPAPGSDLTFESRRYLHADAGGNQSPFQTFQYQGTFNMCPEVHAGGSCCGIPGNFKRGVIDYMYPERIHTASYLIGFGILVPPYFFNKVCSMQEQNRF
jgi:hypothetical protein